MVVKVREQIMKRGHGLNGHKIDRPGQLNKQCTVTYILSNESVLMFSFIKAIYPLSKSEGTDHDNGT